MSNYGILINCLFCGQQPGEALDNHYGQHEYGYRCNDCERIYKSCSFVQVATPLEDSEWEIVEIIKGEGKDFK